MPTFYSVVRIIPDTIAGEFINVGVIAWDGSDVVSRFTRNRGRLRRLTQDHHALLKNFQEWVSIPGSRLMGIDGDRNLEPVDFGRISTRWRGVLQLTPPRPSMTSAQATVELIASLMMPETPSRQHVPTREDAVRAAKRDLSQTFRMLLGEKNSNVICSRPTLNGRTASHEFDFGVANDNSSPVAMLHALSLAGSSGHYSTQVHALAFSAQDIFSGRDQSPFIPSIAAYVLFPDRENKDATEAARILTQNNVRVISRNNIEGWAKNVASELATVPRLKEMG